MTSYLSVQNNQSIAAQPEVDYTFSWAGEVDCTYFGTLFSTGGLGKIRIDVANYVNSGTVAQNGDCIFDLYCPNASHSDCGTPTVDNSGIACSPTYPFNHVYSLKFFPNGGGVSCITPGVGVPAQWK
jgi:hypothetical protein